MTIAEQFSEENLRKEILHIVKTHKQLKDKEIKLVIFNPSSQYNDEYYDYNSAILICVDSDFNEYIIDAYNLVPDSEEQYEIQEETGEYWWEVPKITIKL